jgi:hypothetical protein
LKVIECSAFQGGVLSLEYNIYVLA